MFVNNEVCVECDLDFVFFLSPPGHPNLHAWTTTHTGAILRYTLLSRILMKKEHPSFDSRTQDSKGFSSCWIFEHLGAYRLTNGTRPL